MSNPNLKKAKQKRAMSIANIFFIFLFVRCIEYYVIIPKFGFNTQGVITCVLGIAVMFFYLRIVNGNLRAVGLVMNPKKILKWLGIGAFLSIIPIILTMLLEFIAYKIIGTKVQFEINSFNYRLADKGVKVWLIAILICLVISIIKNLLAESLYRGFILDGCRKLTSFNKSNIIQSLLYTCWFLIIPLRYFIWNSRQRTRTAIIALCLFYVVYEFMSAFKWGLLTRASGAIWISLFDHIFIDFFLETFSFVKPIVGDENRYLRFFVVQAISFALALVYYFYRKKSKPQLFKYGKKKKIKLSPEEIKKLHDEAKAELPEKMIDYHEAKKEL